eukprot:SAG11_NODE_38403_length_252_cov_1.013072_1_plen_33_part_01
MANVYRVPGTRVDLPYLVPMYYTNYRKYISFRN